MTIPLTGTGGLFTRLGKLAKLLRVANTYSAATLDVAIADALSNLGTEYNLAAPLAQQRTSLDNAPSGVGGIVQQMMQSVLLKMVNDDVTLANKNDLTLALNELISQMKTSGSYVNPCSVSTVATARSGNNGTGRVLATSYRGDGLQQQNQFAETAVLTCTGDFQSGTAQLGAEPFTFSGDQPPSSIYGSDWPGASGINLNLTAVDSLQSGNSSGNILQNSDFETFTVPNTPDRWAILTGSAGTSVKQNLSIFYKGLSSLEFVGDGAEHTAIAQPFNDPTGTQTILRPDQSYAVNLWLRVSATPAAGQLTVDLVDGTNTRVDDDQANANQFSVNLPSLSTAWIANSSAGVFRTPRIMPAILKLRLRLSTALDAGKSLYMDSLAMTPITRLYAGGPGLSIFSGVVPFIVNDAYTITIANDRASATYGSTWNTVFDRFLGMRRLGLLLPYVTASTLIPDTLITA